MITDKQIKSIKNDLEQRGIRMPGLENDLLDHLLCSIEMYMANGHTFDKAYSLASYDLHGDSQIIAIQQDTIYALNEGKSLLRDLISYCAMLGLLIIAFNFLSTGVSPALILVCISLSIFFVYHSIFRARKKNSLRSNLLLFVIITSIAVVSVFIFLLLEFNGGMLLGMAVWTILIMLVSIPFYLKAVRKVLVMDSTLTTFFSYTFQLTAVISLLWIPLALSIKLFRPTVAVLFFLDDLFLLAICTFILSISLKKLGDVKLFLQRYL